MKKEVNAQQTQQTEEEIQVIPEESKGRRILNTVINVLLVIAIIVAAICTYVSFVSSSGNGVPSIFGLQMFSIQTESMYPVLKPGDLIFDKAVSDPATLQKGDIITYWTVINGERVLNTHEIFEIYDGGDYRIFATKGKNNNSVDSLTVHESEVVGKYWFRVGGVGKVFDYLQTSTGFLIVVVIPVFIFFLFHLIQFFRVLFEYQNVKNRIKYEQERGTAEELIAASQRQQVEDAVQARANMEAELREKLKAEILANMEKEKQKAEMEAKLREELKAQILKEVAAEQAQKAEPATPVQAEPAQEASVEEAPVEEAPAAEPVEEVPAENAAEEPAAAAQAQEEATV